jgi:hypothetical protein
MTPFEAYVTYMALKQHFTTESYNFKKYNGKIRLSQDKFEKKPDRWFFHKLCKHKDPLGFLVANVTRRAMTVPWIGDIMNSPESEKVYAEQQRRIQALTYNFNQEVDSLNMKLVQAVSCRDGEHPPLLEAYLRGKVSLETMVILCDVIGVIPYWNKQIKEDVIWPRHRLLIEKYRDFFEYDKEKYLEIITQKCVL